ncbi:SGNH/GDSL hydrolase family protein [Enterococcus sp. AZ163]|uniref:SGNH/GDSL hydrolase family protein n=1 Tax=Enterococcus sp. AZ163 TaxID=2774638 RepID=UPI003D2C3EB4
MRVKSCDPSEVEVSPKLYNACTFEIIDEWKPEKHAKTCDTMFYLKNGTGAYVWDCDKWVFLDFSGYTAPDWNAKENQQGYIDNKPFITLGNGLTVSENGELSVSITAEDLSVYTKIDADDLFADKSEFRQFEQDTGQAINIVSEKTYSLESEKVDKNGVGQVGWGMLDQEARENISGGKTAVVGPKSVLTESIVDGVVTRQKTAFPTKIATQTILGTVNIDTVNFKVTCTSNTAVAFGSGFDMPGKAQEVPMEVGGTPTYIGFINGILTVQMGNNTSILESEKATLLCIYYGGIVYAHDYRNISLNGIPLDNRDNSEGTILYGDISVYILEKRILISKGTVIASNRGNFRFAEDADIELTYSSDGVTLYLVADKRTKKFRVLTSIFPESQIILGTIFNGRFYKSSPKSRITVFPLDDVQDAGALSFINWASSRIDIVETSSEKTITISAGQTPIDSRSGLYYRNGSEIKIDFSTYNISPANAVMTLFLVPSKTKTAAGGYTAQSYYVDYAPRSIDDIKVFSYYGKKVYGIDDISRRIIRVNGVENGGWGNGVPQPTPDTESKFKSIEEWFSAVAAGATSKILWLGDSTWAGYTGPIHGSTTPFPQLIQSKLNEYFGSGKVVSANESIGGQTITYFAGQIENLLTKHSDADLVMIGCGLNGINGSSTETRRTAFDTIVASCIEKGMMPIIATAQANQVPNTESGDDWGGRSQFYTTKFDLPLRLGISKKYNLEVIDYTEFTQRLLDNAPEKISELVEDGLHGSAIMHAYQTDWTFKELVPTVKSLSESGIVSIYDQKSFASRSLRYVEDITRDADGFKSQWNYTATENDILMDVWVYLEPEQSAQWNMFASLDAGAAKVVVNGTDYTISGTGKQSVLAATKAGLYHIVVKAQAGTINFKGLKFELI